MIDSDQIERVTRAAQDAAVRLQVRSALNPLLWLCAICTPPSVIGACLSSGVLQVVFALLAATPILCACGAYIYWMLVAPDRLHSEDYQLRRQAMQMIYEKGARSGVLANSVVAIANPSIPMISGDSL
jgi:hypothetical protein